MSPEPPSFRAGVARVMLARFLKLPRALAGFCRKTRIPLSGLGLSYGTCLANKRKG